MEGKWGGGGGGAWIFLGMELGSGDQNSSQCLRKGDIEKKIGLKSTPTSSPYIKNSNSLAQKTSHFFASFRSTQL